MSSNNQKIKELTKMIWPKKEDNPLLKPEVEGKTLSDYYDGAQKLIEGSRFFFKSNPVWASIAGEKNLFDPVGTESIKLSKATMAKINSQLLGQNCLDGLYE